MAYWPNKIQKYLKVTLQNNEAYQMSISLLIVDIQKLFSLNYHIHKGHAIYSDMSTAKIRDKIVLLVVQVYEKSPRFYCLGYQN